MPVTKEKQVATNVTPKTLERIDREAAAREMSRAEYVRMIVLKELSEAESKLQRD